MVGVSVVKCPYTNFNSSMVQLRAFAMWVKGSDAIFQFQYGAIEGIGQLKHFTGQHSFQFQYGAIEGFFVSHLKPHPQDFNSSMVQLRASNALLNSSTPFYFNSSMVQLRVYK